MKLPVRLTLRRNILRVLAEWPVIWHFLQVPLLLCGLWACVYTALVIILDPAAHFFG